MREIMIAATTIHQMIDLILIRVKEMIMIHMTEMQVIITVTMYINFNLILARIIK
jgi:hypothetical protein